MEAKKDIRKGKPRASYNQIPDEIGESIMSYFNPKGSKQTENFLLTVCSSKLLLYHGRNRVKESIDFKCWIFGKISSQLRLFIASKLLPDLGDSITSITVEKVRKKGYICRKCKEKIKFCKDELKFYSKLFSSFRNLQTLALGPNFLKAMKSEVPIFNESINSIFPQPSIFQRSAIFDVFAHTSQTLSHVKLLAGRIHGVEYLETISEQIFSRNKTIKRISTVKCPDKVNYEFIRRESLFLKLLVTLNHFMIWLNPSYGYHRY